MSDLSPAQVALLDEARAEARDDLNNCLDAFREQFDSHGEDWAVTWFVQGLLDEASWDRLNLVTALGEAVARLVAKEPTP